MEEPKPKKKRGRPKKVVINSPSTAGLEFIRRRYEADLSLLKTHYAQDVEKLKRQVAELQREIFELKQAAPLPFDKEPFLITKQ